jgi:hypothetical protein
VFGHIRGIAPVRGGEPEEACEAQRLDAVIQRFERAAIDFGAHVDAEGGLQHRGFAFPVLCGCGKSLCDAPLSGPFTGLLQDGIDDVIRVRRDRFFVFSQSGEPRGTDLRRILFQQRVVPK